MYSLYSKLKTLKFFLSRAYWTKVQKLDRHFEKSILERIVILAQKYFPTYGRAHWRKLKSLLDDFKEEYPFAITQAELPTDLLGVFVPLESGFKKGTIILNTQNSQGLHLSTVAHENGHLMTYLLGIEEGNIPFMDFKPLYARDEELMHSLEDPQELIADYVAAMGAYPLNSFKQAFCNKKGEIHAIYQKYPLILFLRALAYVTTNYWEIARHFISCRNKMFELCLTIHFIRLRVCIYNRYAM